VTAPKPVRVMKARRSSRLACGHVVSIGAQIVGRGTGWRRRWICMDCHLDAVTRNRQASTEERT